jgi:hypothetical protein
MRRALLLAVGLFATGCGSGAERPAPAVPDARPSGTIAFVSDGNRLTAIDVATGRRATRRISSVAGCGPEMHITGGRVVFAGFRRGRTIVYSLPVSLEGRPTRLGTAHAFVRSAREGRVWLAGTACNRSKMVGVREVTAGGEVTATSGRRVPGRWVAGAVRGGLVLQRPGGVVVWDPATGHTVRRLDLDDGGEARGSLIAGCAPGSGCRDLAIVDSATGRTLPWPESRGYRILPGARFSPGGAFAAAAAVEGKRWRVALLDLRSGAATLVPGRRREAYTEVGWTSSGWLVMRATDSRRVTAYRPGAPRPITLPFRLPRYAMLVAG